MKKKPVFCWADPDNEFMAWELQPNEIISDDDAYYKLDFENFDFKQLDECGQSLFQRDKIKQFLDSYHIKMNVEDYITLRNFQHYMHTVWHNYDANVPYRKEIFKLKHRGKDNPMLLSDAFKWKFAGSMESSLLAQDVFPALWHRIQGLFWACVLGTISRRKRWRDTKEWEPACVFNSIFWVSK